ncbi:MAG TPA: aspartate-semialdehyde dehydrogenase [Solirubrobacteraceae bacterium]|nr:aspartate-semialdehyde dehydrogenase [Solirubrobacteraceae bacterium]
MSAERSATGPLAGGVGHRIAVVGATGAVGTVMLECLRERGLDRDNEIILFATPRSAGRVIDGRTVRALDASADLEGIDIALFSAGGGTSKEWAPRFIDAGATVIDNSSAFRRDPEVPLVVSEVNPHALRAHRGLIANPNCSTMQLMVALAPIHREAGIARLVVSTYQSVSGTGRRALETLDAEARASLEGWPLPEPSIYPDHIAFNVIGAAGSFAEGDDHTDEERKMMFETAKILEDQDIAVAVTCVRVPVRVGHSESVNLETRRPLPVQRARELLAAAPGLILEDVPSPLRAAGRDEVFIGRLRRDPTHPNGLAMFVVADNLRKGAATNAVQIAELLMRDGLLSSRPAPAAERPTAPSAWPAASRAPDAPARR